MLGAFTSAHSPGRSLKQPFARIDDGAGIHLLASKLVVVLVDGRINTRDVGVRVDALPVTFGYMVCLVVDAEVGKLLEAPVPPIPSLAMILRVGEIMQSFYSPEITDNHDLRICIPIAGIHPLSATQEAELVSMGIEVLHHLREVVIELLNARCEHAERVVAACANEEHDYIVVRWLVAVLSDLVGEGCAELLLDHSIHVLITLPSYGHGVSVESPV